jgi:dihydrodipicolinate synthase/N-acetylneuraminate lyase
MKDGYTRRDWMARAGSAAVFSRFASAEVAPDHPLQGAFMILSTPYTASKAVDYEDLAGEVDFLERCGVQGLVWPQNASEQSKLTKDERMRGMEVLAKAAKGKKPALVLGVQGRNTEDMLEYAQHAESLAPDAVIAIPPTVATSLEDFRQYYRALCKTVKRPVFIQTSGGAREVEPTIEFIVELARELPNFGYIKEEHDPVIPRMRALIKQRPTPIKRVFCANRGAGFLYEMRLGSDGTIIGGTPYADIYAQLWNLHQQNKFEEQREMFSKLLLMLNLDQQIPGVRPYILKKRGIFKTTVVRQDDHPLSPEAIAEIEYNFAALKPYLKV